MRTFNDLLKEYSCLTSLHMILLWDSDFVKPNKSGVFNSALIDQIIKKKKQLITSKETEIFLKILEKKEMDEVENAGYKFIKRLFDKYINVTDSAIQLINSSVYKTKDLWLQAVSSSIY